MTWTASLDATYYHLEQDETGRVNATTTYNVTGTSDVFTFSQWIGDDFEYTVQACSAYGCSGWSNSSTTTLEGSNGVPNAVPATATSGGTP